jgi:cold shock CspA family protein
MAGAGWPTAGRPRHGTVVAFDEARGLGVVADEDGTELGFHCTAIADGTRSIEVGRRVAFVVQPGNRGRLEARDLVKC